MLEPSLDVKTRIGGFLSIAVLAASALKVASLPISETMTCSGTRISIEKIIHKLVFELRKTVLTLSKPVAGEGLSLA